MKRLLAVLFLLLAAIPLFAQSNAISLSLLRPQFQGAGATLDGERVGIDFGSSLDFGIGYTHRWTEWSLTLDARRFDVSGSAALPDGITNIGTFNVRPVAAIVHYQRGRIFAGAGVAAVFTGDLHSNDLDAAGIGNVSMGDDFTYVIDAGIELPLRGAFGVAIEGRYMPVSVDATAQSQRATVTFDALTLGASLRWKF